MTISNNHTINQSVLIYGLCINHIIKLHIMKQVPVCSTTEFYVGEVSTSKSMIKPALVKVSPHSLAADNTTQAGGVFKKTGWLMFLMEATGLSPSWKRRGCVYPLNVSVCCSCAFL